MATQGGYTWSYVDEDGNGQNVVADSAFILEWTELSDLHTANDEGKTDLELVFSEEPDLSQQKDGRPKTGGRTLAMVTRREKRFCGACGELEHSGSRGRLHLRSGRGIRNGTVSYGFEVKSKKRLSFSVTLCYFYCENRKMQCAIRHKQLTFQKSESV